MAASISADSEGKGKARETSKQLRERPCTWINGNHFDDEMASGSVRSSRRSPSPAEREVEPSPPVDTSDGMMDIANTPPAGSIPKVRATRATKFPVPQQLQHNWRHGQHLSEMLSKPFVQYLASLGYTSTADLRSTGITNADWPVFVDWCSGRVSGEADMGEAIEGLTPVTCFLITSR